MQITHELLFIGGGGGVYIKIYLIPPIPPKALYNSNDPPSLAVNFL